MLWVDFWGVLRYNLPLGIKKSVLFQSIQEGAYHAQNSPVITVNLELHRRYVVRYAIPAAQDQRNSNDTSSATTTATNGPHTRGYYDTSVALVIALVAYQNEIRPTQAHPS